jgi:hypothetical protein
VGNAVEQPGRRASLGSFRNFDWCAKRRRFQQCRLANFLRLSEGTGKLGLEALRGFLQRHRRIALDTSIFIHELEATPRYAAFTAPIFSWIERRGIPR